MKAIILAAGVGKRLKKFTSDPKCLIKIDKEPLIIRNIKLFNKFNIREIVVVAGYKAEKVIKAVEKYNLEVKFIINNDFTEGSILSLWCAAEEFEKDILIMDADLYFEEALLTKLLESKKRNFFLIDTKAKRDNEAVIVGFKDNRAVALERGLKGEYPVSGEWAGFLKLSGSASKKIKNLLKEKVSNGERKIGYEFIVPHLFDRIAISYELADGLKWVEIDFPKDVNKARHLYG